MRDGKGQKDGSVPLPEKCRAALAEQVERVRQLHESDLKEGYGTVYLPYALERKYPNTNKAFHWQYVFPSRTLSVDPRSGRKQRHHVFENAVQKSLRQSTSFARMRSILKILKPSALAGILLLVILLVQGACCTSGSMTCSVGSDKPDKTQSSYGVGAPITVTTVNGVTNRDIRWPILLTNLAVSYLLAVVLASAFTRATRFRRPAATYATVAVIMVVVSFLASIGMSRWYWGYFFARPSVLNEVSDVASVSAVIPITTVVDHDGARRIVAQNDYSIADRVAYGRKDEYYCLHQRLLLALDDAGLLPPSHSTEMADLPILFPLMQKTGILAGPEDGYNDSDLVQGVLIDALNHAGNRLVFIGVNGRQLSNDHYPYYEMVFTGSAGSPALSYVRGHRFFYDVAGIEGGEWYLVWPFLALVGVVIAFVVVTVLVLIWRLVGRTQKAQQGAAPPPSAPTGPSEGASR